MAQTAELLHLLEDVKSLLSSTLRKNSRNGTNEKLNSTSKTDKREGNYSNGTYEKLHSASKTNKRERENSSNGTYEELNSTSKTNKRDSIVNSLSVKSSKLSQELSRKEKEPTTQLTTNNSTYNNNNTNKNTDKKPLIIISPITGSNTLKLNEYLDKHSTLSESSLNFSSDILKHQNFLRAYSTPKDGPGTRLLNTHDEDDNYNDDDTAASVYSGVDYTEDESQISDADTTQETQSGTVANTTAESTRDQHANKKGISINRKLDISETVLK